MKIYAWESMLPFYFYFSKTYYTSFHLVQTSIDQSGEQLINRDAETTD